MTKLAVHKQRIGPILGRHPWVFSGALKQIPEGLKSGEPVVLTDEEGKFLAQGYFNSYSQIAVRLWSWNESEIVDDNFFAKRISQAYEIRKKYVETRKTDSYRLVHSENDLLPGLIVDKYADYLVLQFHTPGMEFWKDKIVNALKKVVKPKGIYERSDVAQRLKRFVIPTVSTVIPSESRLSRDDEGSLSVEQLGQRSLTPQGGFGMTKPTARLPAGRQARDDKPENLSGLLYGTVPERIKITENGFKFWVDVIGGQKTGFFLDQRDKRQALTKYVEDKTVLNCFSYSGGFSIYALGAGAKHVVSVDSSAGALELAQENVKLNKFDLKKCEFICGDVKQYLNQQLPARPHLGLLLKGEGVDEPSPARRGQGEVRGNQFDVIILDPPAFVKDRHKVKEGLMGYKKINEAALRLLSPGGVLATCSCSAHVTLPDFRYMLSESAGRARQTLQVLETYTHGIDHPELAAFTEGEYLKCIFARVA